MSVFPKTIAFKTLVASDVSWLATLHRQCFENERRWNEDLLLSSLQNPATIGFAALSDNLPAGFILCSYAADEAEILTLCIAPPMQRRGLAQFLIQESLRTLHEKKIKKIFLEVAVDNIPAIELYKKMNFKTAGLRKNYYMRANVTLDALIMMNDAG